LHGLTPLLLTLAKAFPYEVEYPQKVRLSNTTFRPYSYQKGYRCIMDVREMRCVLVIAEEMNLTRAAE
jgi:hypothetical protein